MSTKGPSNKYVNTRGSSKRCERTKGINFQYAKDYNKRKLKEDFIKHGKSFGTNTKEAYESHAVHFANVIDKKWCISFIDAKGTTHKYNRATNTYVAVDKRGYVVTYFKPSQGVAYYRKKKGEKNGK